MKVKNVVKVMNFHSLLRVDKARKEADKYFVVEKELRVMIDSIANNRNTVLDKRLMKVDASKPTLNVYIGSDLGFCGAYNSVVNDKVRNDNGDKILIGKKLNHNRNNVIIDITKEDYMSDPGVVTRYIQKVVKKADYSEINVVYNNYINAGTIEFISKKVYPFAFNEDSSVTYNEDYVSEDDITELLTGMVSTYVDYEIQIIVKNSLASENIMRQNSTNESLKKIDEIEEEEKLVAAKDKINKESQRNVERFVKRRYRKVESNG